MSPSLKRLFSALNFEERIFHAAVVVALISVVLPWISGEWLGAESTITYTGLGFFTGTIGWMILLLHLVALLFMLIPNLGGPVLVKRRHLPIVRLLMSSQATVLSLVCLIVLMNVTFEFSRMEVRFGVYVTFVSSVVAMLYAWLEWQQQKRKEGHEVFHHPEAGVMHVEQSESPISAPPPPPPPPPLEPEEHHLHGR